MNESRFKKLKNKLGKVIRKSYELPLWKWLVACFIISLVEVIFLEMLGRRSLLSPFVFIFHNPLVFLYNILIIYFTLTISLLFKRRGFAMGLISLLWIAVGFINFILLGYRITPFSAVDFIMFSDVLSMFNIYFNLAQRIAIILGIILFIIIIVVAFLKTPKLKGKVNYIQGTIVVLVMFTLVYLMTFLALESSLVSDKFTNLGTAYKSYGFVYCFSNSVIDQGISKPDNYSEETIESIENDVAVTQESYEKIMNSKKTFYTKLYKRTPHIIVVQLESFIDIDRVKGVHTDKEAIPNFKKYQEIYPSGFLTVPAIGAGTANSEFEILTGMKSKIFGAGEYPYKTVLTTTPCESMAQLLLANDYGTHAIHNNKAKFYSRDVSYANLGFQTFTSLEYMQDFNRTLTGWAKDDCLPDEIINCLDYDDNPDFVFTISVQGHGRYPKTELKSIEHVKVTLDNEDEELTNQFGYYVNQCYEMDEMIADLKGKLDARGEDYILLLYGDHIPSLNFEEDQFIKGSQTQTEYVIISNYVTGLKDKDMYAYEMSDYILRSLGYPTGIMQDIHQTYYDKDNTVKFDDAVHQMQYDMLYGDRFIYNQITPYEKADMRLGLYDIKINNIEYNSSTGSIIIRGENFTQFSNILINDERIPTTFVDNETIMIISDKVSTPPQEGDTFVVAQIDKDKHELSRSEEYIYTEEK